MRAQWLAIVGLAAAVNFSAIRADTPAAQLEKGIFQQETAGDLDAAVKVYKQIVDEANANRRFVAEAQFRIGECYQKQGKKAEAEAAFRQVVAVYPDQVELVAKARKELGESEPARAPNIVSTSPAAFADNVSPALDKITVTFDQKMKDASWSWTGGGDTFPKVKKPYYDAAKMTCTLPCKLEPGKVYWVGINAPSFKNFRSAEGLPAHWYIILFATQSADGKPTPISAALLEQAKPINAEAGVIAITDQDRKAAAQSVMAATQAAEQWLAALDAGKYADCWEQSAALMRRAVAKVDLEASLRKVLQPFGKVVSRKLLSTNYTKSLPGAPDGEYVIMQYQTDFDSKKGAVETITPMKDADGRWRVSGYYVK